MDFDYGTENVQELQSNIKYWPKEGERLALIDADSIAYIVGYTSELIDYLTAKNSPEGVLGSKIFADKCDYANFILNKWVTDAGCDSAWLYLTDSASNFRFNIAKTKPYKGNRIEEKPPFFQEVRQWLVEFHGARFSKGCEADDEISIEAWKRHEQIKRQGVVLWSEEHKKLANFVVVSGDKDLGIIPGWRCPPDGPLEWVEPIGSLEPVWREKEVVAYEYWPVFKGEPVDTSLCFVPMMYQGKMQAMKKETLTCLKDKWEMDHVWHFNECKQDIVTRGADKGKGKFKRVKAGTAIVEYIHKLKGTGLKFFYAQTIMGDTVDNYPGIEGKGSTRAYELLDSAASEQELVSRVRQEYKEAYGKEADSRFLEMGRLAWMQTSRGEMWQPPHSEGYSFPL